MTYDGTRAHMHTITLEDSLDNKPLQTPRVHALILKEIARSSASIRLVDNIVLSCTVALNFEKSTPAPAAQHRKTFGIQKGNLCRASNGCSAFKVSASRGF